VFPPRRACGASTQQQTLRVQDPTIENPGLPYQDPSRPDSTPQPQHPLEQVSRKPILAGTRHHATHPIPALTSKPIPLIVRPDPITLPPLPAPSIHHRHAPRPLARRVDADVLRALAAALPSSRVVREHVPDAERVVEG
jgi:hypothetical protein